MRLSLSILAMTLLMACDAPQPTVPSSEAPVLARSATAGPGPRAVTAARAASYFAALCGVSDQGRARVDAAAALNGFVRNSRTTTYYNRQDNLSVKLANGRCSIVFASNDGVAAIRRSFAKLDGDLGKVFIYDTGVHDGKRYYRAGT